MWENDVLTWFISLQANQFRQLTVYSFYSDLCAERETLV